ncbi:MAG: hypothetical protein IJ074_07905 [Clostridia bacterium]|nr:hypothetical protein [Clostridia bacterium]MBQ8972985.1 hypothetical protein [Clostridia bacterium]
MKSAYITITGLKHYYGGGFLEPNMTILLVKEPDNAIDREAIRAEVRGLGKIGYVANSPYTVLGESCSAGRIYDRIGETAVAKVKYVLPRGVVCRIKGLAPIGKAEPEEE